MYKAVFSSPPPNIVCNAKQNKTENLKTTQMFMKKETIKRLLKHPFYRINWTDA